MGASKYTDEKAMRILYAIEGGQSVRKACEQAGIAKSTFLDWIEARPVLQAAYRLAKEAREKRIREEIAEAEEDISIMEALIPKKRDPWETRHDFSTRRAIMRGKVHVDLLLRRVHRDELKWTLARMTARAR